MDHNSIESIYRELYINRFNRTKNVYRVIGGANQELTWNDYWWNLICKTLSLPWPLYFYFYAILVTQQIMCLLYLGIYEHILNS